jgi:hypothetical protein
MPTLRTGLIAAAVALMASAATVAATQASGHAAPPAPAHLPESGIATLHTDVNLPPSTWTSVPLQVSLPHAGTYEVDADVRGRLQGNVPLNTYITARLWNVTSNQEAIYSDRLVYQLINYDNPTTTYAVAGNQTAPISELITVTRPTVIQLQAEDVNSVGKAGIAQIYSGPDGYTTLRYERVRP